MSAIQRFHCNQFLSVGWSLSIGKIREKLWTNQKPSLEQYFKCDVPYKVRINRINIIEALLLLSMPKKVNPGGQGWAETKLLELKHLLDQKICQMKNHPKLKDFLLWKLPIKTHLKKTFNLVLCVTVTPFPPNQLIALGVCTTFLK